MNNKNAISKLSTNDRNVGYWLAPTLLLSLLLSLCYWIYYPGLYTPLFFDDATNLGGLSSVVDFESAVTFVVGGASGPGGRPLALASFLLHAGDWPNNLFYVKQVNLLIHLLNAILVYWIALEIGKSQAKERIVTQGFALTVCAFWVMHPLLLSTTLMAVQRMTSLSALFVLSGIVLYLMGRKNLITSPKRGLFFLFSSVTVFLPLAVLSKENGILLPVFILILNRLLPENRPKGGARLYAFWQLSCLWLPIAVVLSYVVFKWGNFLSGYLSRDFTLAERLMTECRVVIDYLTQLFYPMRSRLSPFQDNNLLSTGWFAPISTLVSLLSILALLIASWCFRRRYRVLMFAVLWFFLGHSLESSVIPLEIYFQHRNYLPALGPIVLLCWLAWFGFSHYRKWALACLAVFFMTTVFVLIETVSIWKQPVLAASLWVEENPRSVRARQFLTEHYAKADASEQALATISQAYKEMPERTDVGLQVLQLSCALHRVPDGLMDKLDRTIKNGVPGNGVTTTLVTLLNMADEKICPEVNWQRIKRLVDGISAHPMIMASTGNSASLQRIYAGLYGRNGNFNGVMLSLERAYELSPSLDTLKSMVDVLSAEGLQSEAQLIVTNAEKNLPLNPVKRRLWEREILIIKAQLSASR